MQMRSRSPSVPLIVLSSMRTPAKPSSIIDSGPGPASPAASSGDAASGAQHVSLQGKVQRSLYGPASDINGRLLDDSTIERVGPREAHLGASVLNRGAAGGGGLRADDRL